MISIIIPVYNEESILEETLSDLVPKVNGGEIILVDGKSSDRTLEIAGRFGQVVVSERGRGPQLNAGAKAAAGDVLLFLHADCRLEEGAMEAIVEAMDDSALVGGCFRQRIDGDGFGFRLIEFGIHLRSSWWHMMYGDQGVFVRRTVFFEIGGVPEIPLMEDVELSKRLRRAGMTRVIDKTLTSSARRWQRLGKFRTTATNWSLRLLHAVGVSPQILARIYYGNSNGR